MTRRVTKGAPSCSGGTKSLEPSAFRAMNEAEIAGDRGMAPTQRMFSREMATPKTSGRSASFRIPFLEGEANMSRMTKGRAEAEQVDMTPANESTHRGSHRRLKVSQPEPVLLALADALRDILHDELRATG
jgi:hypothetical protein